MITNGTISFEKRINDGDFQHRIARSEITFTADGGDVADFADEARLLARRQVFTTLDITPSGLVVPASMPPVVEGPERLAATTSAMEQRHAMPESDQVGAGESGMPTPKKRGRKSVSDPTVVTTQPPSSATAPQDAPSASSTGASPATVVPTDEMLRSACNARNERGLAEDNLDVGTEIRALIAHFVGEPGRKAADISMKDRPEFLRYLLAQTLHVDLPL